MIYFIDDHYFVVNSLKTRKEIVWLLITAIL